MITMSCRFVAPIERDYSETVLIINHEGYGAKGPVFKTYLYTSQKFTQPRCDSFTSSVSGDNIRTYFIESLKD